MDLPRNIALVVNPVQPKAIAVANTIVAVLKCKNIEHTVFTTSWPQNWVDITEAWVVGGDGTLNYFINQYPQFELPIALFKGGTGNDFQKLLYGKITIEQQIKKLLGGNVHFVDAGLCNDKLFLNGVGIGFDGAIVKSLLVRKKLQARFLISFLF